MTTNQQERVPELTVGDRLRKARVAAGFEQQEFADAIGVSRGTVHNYETDRSKPKRPVLLSWSLATSVPLSWLQDGHDGPDGGGPDGGVTKNSDAVERLAATKRARHAASGATSRYPAAA